MDFEKLFEEAKTLAVTETFFLLDNYFPDVIFPRKNPERKEELSRDDLTSIFQKMMNSQRKKKLSTYKDHHDMIVEGRKDELQAMLISARKKAKHKMTYIENDKYKDHEGIRRIPKTSKALYPGYTSPNGPIVQGSMRWEEEVLKGNIKAKTKNELDLMMKSLTQIDRARVLSIVKLNELTQAQQDKLFTKAQIEKERKEIWNSDPRATSRVNKYRIIHRELAQAVQDKLVTQQQIDKERLESGNNNVKAKTKNELDLMMKSIDKYVVSRKIMLSLIHEFRMNTIINKLLSKEILPFTKDQAINENLFGNPITPLSSPIVQKLMKYCDTSFQYEFARLQIKEIKLGYQPSENETKTLALTKSLSEYGFFELPMVKKLNDKLQAKLIDIVVSKGSIGYSIAMLQYLGFPMYLLKHHLSSITEVHKFIATCFKCHIDTVRKNKTAVIKKKKISNFPAFILLPEVQRDFDKLTKGSTQY